MTTTTLVAGATGYLGRFIVAELHRRHPVLGENREVPDTDTAYGLHDSAVRPQFLQGLQTLQA